MYTRPKFQKSLIKSYETKEGEPIEVKIERLISNKEPIEEGAPLIYTERKKGVQAAYNIRTDTFELAAEASDKKARSEIAKRDSKPKTEESEEKSPLKIVKDEPIQGKQQP